ncbi:MAG TPA: hypothetical protein VKM55_25220 [Candidatus Lokiarchaeia archaeon]|nr:hypothetical protein [Candidatus Lokiarchaeia archaeon]
MPKKVQSSCLREFKVPRTLANWLENADLTPKTRFFLDDFDRLLDYCWQNNGMVLLPITRYFPRDAVSAMNQLLHEPDLFKERITQLSTSFVHFFYCAAWFLGLFDIAPGLKLVMLERALTFSVCSALQKFTILFDSLWSKIRWQALQGNPNGRPDGVQDYRNQLAYFLARINVGERIKFRSLLAGSATNSAENDKEMVCLDTLNFTMNHGVFPNRIMPLLKRMDLVDFDYVKPGEMHASHYFLEISWIQVMPIGKKIFRSIGNLREPRSR